MLRFVKIALDSLAEKETHLIIAYRQKYMDKENLDLLLTQVAEIGRLVQGLRIGLQKRLNTNS